MSWATTWFLSHRDESLPVCRIAGQPASIADGVERAAQILLAAKYPLVYGLDDTTCEAQRVAVSIADWIGGTVDTSTSVYQGPWGVAFQGVGEVTCSLGEVANRGDLIIFWGSNPAESHPRHFSKYSLLPKGMFVPRGREDRTCVVVDVHRTKSVESADVFLQIKPGKDFEALWILRALAHDMPLDAAEVERDTGVPLAAWQDLMARMKQARFGVMLFGMGLTMTRGEHLNSEALLALVRDMNAYTRFVAKPMRGQGNVTGADNVVTWRTGYPFGVNLSRGYPRFNPGEYTAAEMLARGEADAAMIVASDPLSMFSEAGPSPAGRDSLHRARLPRNAHDPRRHRRVHHGHLRHQTPARFIAWTTCRFRCGRPWNRRTPATSRCSRGIERRVQASSKAVPVTPSRWPTVAVQNRRRHRLRSGQRHRRPGARPVDRRRQDRRPRRPIRRCGPIRRSTPRGLVVMPGGIDMHCHIAGPKVNVARKMRPEEKRTAAPVDAHRQHAQRHDGQRAQHVCHRLQVRRHGLHHGLRRRHSAAGRPARPRGVRRHALHRQGLLRPDGQQPLHHAGHSGTGARAAEGVSRLAACRRPRATRRSSSIPAASKSGSSSRRATFTASIRRSTTSTSRRGRSFAASPQAADELTPAAPRAHSRQQPGPARQLDDHAGNDAGPGRPRRAHDAHPVPQLRRRRRTTKTRSTPRPRRWPSTSTSTRTSRSTSARCCSAKPPA